MRRFVTTLALLTLIGLLAPAIAQAQYREFKGKVDKLNKRELIVDNRMGDKLKFKPDAMVVVEGEKDDWKRLRKGDWVIVSWKMMDNPRIAYKVLVLPEQKEGAEDVE